MNVQLILYPQNYRGRHSSMSSWEGEFLMDATLNFLTIDSSTDYATAVGLSTFPAMFDAINNNAAIVNQWQRYKTPNNVIAPTGNGTISLYTAFHIPAQDSSSGVYQRLSSLIVGQSYTLTLEEVVAVPTTIYNTVGLQVSAFAGNTTTLINTSQLLTGGDTTSASTVHTFDFIAQTSSDTIFISFFGQTSQEIHINIASIAETGTVPGLVYTDLSDGQVIVDLYEDEDIPLSLSVDDFKNTAEKVQSYSKAFNLPATKRNNQIFDSMFEITRTTMNVLSFNPYIRTQCVLKQEGFILFEGYLRMLDISDKDGEVSYNVNLFSEAVALADVLKDRTFANINTNELDHVYDITAITNSWNDSGTAFPYTNPSTSGYRSDYDTLKYPFVDWTKQWLISNGTNGTSGMPQLKNLEQAFRPFLQVKYLIDRIFKATNIFTYTSDFFNTDDFKKLYMDFNWGASEFGSVLAISGTLRQMWQKTYTTTPIFYINETSYNANSFLKFNVNETNIGGVYDYWDNTKYKFTSPVNNLEVELYYQIKLRSYAGTYAYYNFLRVGKFNSNGQCIEVLAENNASIPSGYAKDLVGTVDTVLQVGEYIQAQSYVSQYAADNDKIGMSNFLDAGGDPLKSIMEFKVKNQAQDPYALVSNSRADVNQWTFLKGIMNMFNLVTIPNPDNPNNLLIEPYSDVFIDNTFSNDVSDLSLKSRGVEHDWTEKIDISNIKLEPLTDLNKRTIFKFVEDEDDWVFKTYKRNTINPVTGGGHLYGSQMFDASAYNILDGDDEVVAEPFAATIPTPLTADPVFAEFIVPQIYSSTEEGETSGFANKPRIMYNNGVKTLAGVTYYIPAQNNGAAVDAQDSYLQFSHLSEIGTTSSTIDFHFGVCQLFPPIGQPTLNNLYETYWAPYYNELYNPDTRTMTLKVNLNAADINTFNFYDTVMIKNREFRVNKIDYKPNDLAVVEFILIP